MRPLLLIALALVAAGCVPRAPLAERPAGPPARTRTIALQGGFVDVRLDIPLAPPGPKPAVVSFLDAARGPLLEAGIIVVGYEVHWERLRVHSPTPAPAPEGAPPAKPVGKWLLAAPSAKTVGKGYFELIRLNAETTVPQVLDAIADEPELDPRRIGILGHSTNGFIAIQAVAADPRLRAAVLLAACGEYRSFLHHSALAMDGAPLDLDPTYARWLDGWEAAHRPAAVAHAAVLMVNGRDDRAVPRVCSDRTAVALRPAYRALGSPERFRYLLHPGGHVIDEAARREALAWLRRWLGPS